MTMSIYLSLLLPLLFLMSSRGTYGIPLDEFYPFGEDAGDSLLERTLDGSSSVIELVNSVFPFYGREYDQLYVNANGHISFLASVGAFVPERFPLEQPLRLIAPFWADSDTGPEDGGHIWYRNSTDSDILSSVAEIIRSNFLGVESFDPNFLFIVTWDHIGYYSRHTDRSNTFQCVMVTDGDISFVVFLYADGLIQWLWSDDHEGIPAEVGVNTGDGIHFFRHPDSNTLNLLNITTTSNVDMPGVWVIRTDEEGAPIKGCRKDSNELSGNMLGGTAVTISGPCFETSNAKVLCRFDHDVNQVAGFRLSSSLSLCTTPELSRAGSVPFEMEYDGNIYTSTFFSISPERAYSVDLLPGGLLLTGEDRRTISWSPDSILSSQLASQVVPNPGDIRVDIKLYHQELKPSIVDGYQWIQDGVLGEGLPNTGEASVVIPPNNITCRYPIAYHVIHFSICPIAFKITVNELPDSTEAQVTNFFRETSVGQWSGVAFLMADDTSDTRLRETCEQWSNADGQSSTLSQLPACPPTVRLARFDADYQQVQLVSSFVRSSLYHENSMSLFHPNSHTCFNEAVPQSLRGQECCYNVDGNLVKGAPGGGSADAMSPRVSFNGHLRMDLAPYLICCTGSAANCEQYFSERPGGEEIDYDLPIPVLCNPQCVDGACVEGNTCVCSQGFTGNRCEVPIMSVCDENFCQNGGACIKHVLTVMCECPPGFIGYFCQEKEPPFHIRLINSSPRVGTNQIIVDFTASKPIKQAKCFLTGQKENNCTSGHVAYNNIPAATYIFRVVAHTYNGERAVTRRIIHVIGDDGPGDDDIFCAVNLVNDGVTIRGKSVTAHFVTTGSATTHLCRLDSHAFRRCRSPLRYQNVPVGTHRIQIQPQGDGCGRNSRFSVKFYVTEV